MEIRESGDEPGREVPATPLPQGAGEEEEQLREPLPRIRAGLAKGGAGLAEVVGQGREVRAQRLQAVASR